MHALNITHEMNVQAVLDAYQTALESGNHNRADKIWEANEDLQAAFSKIWLRVQE